MIRPLLAAMEEYPALGRVEAKGHGCGEWHRLELSTIEQRTDLVGCTIDLSTILTTDEAAEVGEMCGIQGICRTCSDHHLLDPQRDACEPQGWLPVTFCLFLWTGETVDSWAETIPVCWNAGELDGKSPLTAVVLVGEPQDGAGRVAIDTPRRMSSAREACAEAGIPFIIPDDPERGRLTL